MRDVGTGLAGCLLAGLQGGLSSAFARRAREAGCQRGEHFLRSGKAMSIWLALQPVTSQPGSVPVNGHRPHRPGLCCDQQEMLAPGGAAGSERVCVCVRVRTRGWTDQASNVSTPQTFAEGLRHRNVGLACRCSPREDHW